MKRQVDLFGRKRLAPPLLLGAALLFAYPSPGGAGVLVWEDYGKSSLPSRAESHKAGGREGFNVHKSGHEEFVKGGATYPNTGLTERGGAVQVLVSRLLAPSHDALLEVEGAFQILVNWERDSRSTVTIRGIEPGERGLTNNDRAWRGTVFPMGVKNPQSGEWHVITVVWGNDSEANHVYVDDREGVPMEIYAEDPSRVKFNTGSPDVFVGRSNFTNDRGFNVDSHGSLIGGVALYDQPLTPSEVAASADAWISGNGMATLPAITAVASDASRIAGFSGKLVAGNSLAVSVEGSAGAVGTFDILHYPDLDRKIDLDWSGWGVYLEDKVFYESGEVNLREVGSYRVYASKDLFDPAAPGFEPVEELKVERQKYTLENLEIDTPYYVAVVAVMRDGSLKPVIAPIVKQPLTETRKGVYHGSYSVGWQDRYPRAVVIGRLANAGAMALLQDTKFFTIDPSLTLTVAAAPTVLKADEKSESGVTVTVTNANGDPVSGHKIKFVLATTSQYTGVVGGGAFADQVGGTVSESRWGKTDLFGKLTTTYKAGFAAKTAIIVARDMLSNDTGAGYVKTYIQATAELELEPVVASAAMDAGYAITVTSSDEWLTADGQSQARITARVTLNDKPVEGHKVSFDVSGLGTIRTVKDTTGRDGEARAVFTAGKKIGIVLITATDTTVGISGSVQIELRSDAPAKIAIKIKPEKLPADGRSRADLEVLVTDINDNPNDNTEIEYSITTGSGRLRDETTVTDRNGESSAEYTAGTEPGKVTFELTVRSMQPTDEDIAKARGFALAVTDYKFF